jgi:hypothetical protein
MSRLYAAPRFTRFANDETPATEQALSPDLIYAIDLAWVGNLNT